MAEQEGISTERQISVLFEDSRKVYEKTGNGSGMEVHGMELKTEMETQPLGFSSYVSWSSTHLQFLITCFAIL